jgi:hypothetical protein
MTYRGTVPPARLDRQMPDPPLDGIRVVIYASRLRAYKALLEWRPWWERWWGQVRAIWRLA